MRRSPLTLRDFLELGCDSSSDGFRTYPRCLLPCSDDDPALQQAPVRLLVEADHLRRSPSRSPSSLFSLVSRSPGPGALARISRSFSRRIKEGFFWKRREDEDELYLDDRDSCGFPSPQVSSCGSASDSETESEYYAEAEDDALDVDGTKEACPSTSEPAFHCEKQPSSSSSSSVDDHDDCTAAGAAADGNKIMQADDGDSAAAVGRGGELGMEEDKQQLSPVSVMDFPFDDDDDADERSDAGTACSPSFHRFPPPPDLLPHGRTMTKQAQLLHKIRRYDDGSIAQAVDPVDLEARFTTTSSESVDASSTHPVTPSSCCTDTSTSSASTAAPCHGAEEHQSVEQPSSQAAEQEEPDEYRLLARLLQEETAAAADEASQMLLLDFFTEGIDNRLRCSSAVVGSSVVRRVDDDEWLVRAGAEWLRGAGTQWGIGDVMLSGKAALEDMERGRRWMCVGEEERDDVGAAVEGFVVDGLVDELVAELVAPYLLARR